MNVDRDELKRKYKKLFFELQSILFEHDLMGINFEDNTDEYDPELGTILPRLSSAKNSDDVSKIIFEEFKKWFDADMAEKISKNAYNNLGKDMWVAWSKYNEKET